jgi:superfamily I DNA and/or RNA helicase
VKEVLDGCRIVFATLTGCADRLLRDAEMFDVVVIDEAGQVIN